MLLKGCCSLPEHCQDGLQERAQRCVPILSCYLKGSTACQAYDYMLMWLAHELQAYKQYLLNLLKEWPAEQSQACLGHQC